MFNFLAIIFKHCVNLSERFWLDRGIITSKYKSIMKKLVFAFAIAGLTIAGTSCKKETTCECQTYEYNSDGSKDPVGDKETKVVESKDADCSQFNSSVNNPIGGDRVTECEEKVFD